MVRSFAFHGWVYRLLRSSLSVVFPNADSTTLIPLTAVIKVSGCTTRTLMMNLSPGFSHTWCFTASLDFWSIVVQQYSHGSLYRATYCIVGSGVDPVLDHRCGPSAESVLLHLKNERKTGANYSGAQSCRQRPNKLQLST